MTRIGVTGHQEISSRARNWLSGAIETTVAPFGHFIAISSLAAGADQIFASVALAIGADLWVVLPMHDYASRLAGSKLDAFDDLLRRATHVDTLTILGSDEDAYLAAGMRVVDLADLLIAVWDGKPARGPGGTADVVAYAASAGKPYVWLDPIRLTTRTGGAQE